jgi:hypothetical protein
MALRKFIFLNPTEGYSEEQAATDELSLGKVTALGVGGISFDATGDRIVNIPDVPTALTDAVNANYVQAYSAGLDWKQSVRLATAAALPANTAAGSGVGKTLTADANGALSVDGIAVANGNRILVKDEATGADNGIYVVTDLGSAGTPYVLTRATDFDQNAEVTDGAAVFVGEGSTLLDTGWVLITNDPITVDTTVLVFTQFTGTGAIIAGAGLLKTGSTIDVELDTAAGAQTTGADGGSSGLEFDVTGVGGKLRAKVDPAGGIQRLAAGLALEIDDTPNTLDVDADGLKVVGLPSLFLINDVATSANVTAANLNTLTAGADSAADALHFHRNQVQIWVTSANTDLGDGVYISGNDTVAPGDPTVDAQARVIGVARETVTSPNPVEIVVSGVVPGALTGATANAPYYLGAGGAPVLYATLTGGDRTIRLGYAKNATDLEVRIHDYGKKTA